MFSNKFTSLCQACGRLAGGTANYMKAQTTEECITGAGEKDTQNARIA